MYTLKIQWTSDNAEDEVLNSYDFGQIENRMKSVSEWCIENNDSVKMTLKSGDRVRVFQIATWEK